MCQLQITLSASEFLSIRGKKIFSEQTDILVENHSMEKARERNQCEIRMYGNEMKKRRNNNCIFID